MDIAYGSVVLIHSIWMFLFAYGWLLIPVRPRFAVTYFTIFISTIGSWLVWGSCPITTLQRMLKGNDLGTTLTARPDIIFSFIFVLMFGTWMIGSIVQYVARLEKGRVGKYFRANVIELGGTAAFMCILIALYGVPRIYLWANIALSAVLLLVGLSLAFRSIKNTAK